MLSTTELLSPICKLGIISIKDFLLYEVVKGEEKYDKLQQCMMAVKFTLVQ